MIMFLLSEARKHLADIVSDSNKKLRLFFIKDEENSLRSWVMGEKFVELLFDSFTCQVEWEKESKLGFWTAYVPELDLWGKGDTWEEAAEDLVSAALDYMEVFLNNIPFYLNAGRKKHLPYIFRLLMLQGNRDKMREFLGLA